MVLCFYCCMLGMKPGWQVVKRPEVAWERCLTWVTSLDMVSGEVAKKKRKALSGSIMCLWYSGGRWIRWVCLCTRVCLCVCACMCVWEYVPESIVISQIIWLHRLDLAPRRDGTFTVFHIYNICSVGGMCSRSHTSLAPCYKTATSVVYYLVIDTENDVALQLCPNILYNK